MSMRNRHHLIPFLTWLLSGIGAAVVIGWAAAELTLTGIAPLAILPVGVGITLGATLVWLAAKLGMERKNRLVAGAFLLATVAVAAEHAWLYLDFRREWHEAQAKDARVALFRPSEPWSPAEYFARELKQDRAVLWTVDAALVLAGVVGVVLIGCRRGGKFSAAADANPRNPKP